MRVVTLLNDKFEKACQKLSVMIGDGYRPDIIVGILTGGGYVGREVSRAWPEAQYVEVRVQRKDTAKKEKGVRHVVLQSLPYFVLNWLRMAEMVYEDVRAKQFEPKREGKVELSDKIDAQLREKEQNILLVDDAIDTGATLKFIKDTLTEKYPLARIKIAVITVTSNHPLIDADYCLFHDRTLVRFPWSNDVKQKK